MTHECMTAADWSSFFDLMNFSFQAYGDELIIATTEAGKSFFYWLDHSTNLFCINEGTSS